MKNIINYYYNLKVSDIRQRDGITYFFINGIKYVFIPYTKDLELIKGIYELNSILIKKNIYVHQIILNAQGQILTYVNNEYYMLMKVLYPENKISLNDILYLNNIDLTAPDVLIRNKWGNLWADKNDYLEYQISQLGKKHPAIRESVSYYLGLAETSISLVNDLNSSNIKLFLSHVRIRERDTLFDLYNPLNMILDYRVRDSAEYFKDKFFNNNDIAEELNYFIRYIQLTYEEWVLFFARLLYPSYYFDLYEDIINGREEEEKLDNIVSKHEEYEKVLTIIYFNLRNYPSFPIIDYFENKKNII